MITAHFLSNKTISNLYHTFGLYRRDTVCNYFRNYVVNIEKSWNIR